MDAGNPGTVTLQVNGVEVKVPKGELIVESVKRLGLEIPVFCYHPRMKPVGMCRMCLVEVGFKQPDGTVRMMPKPQAGCTLPASDGMVVVTDSEAVHRDRRGVLEFLLVNHPLDCPICDRGGECPLQNNTMAYGPSTSRFIELKRHLPKAYPLSQYVTLDLERCIQCGRCVRFTEEISGEHELAFRFRGAEMQPSTFQLLDFESKFSGNVIEICPVGALTNSNYRFRARPWDLEASPGLCTLTSCGTNVWIDHRSGRFVRINARTNERTNEEWTCDRTKFGHEFYNGERIESAMVRHEGSFKCAEWPEALRAAVDGCKDKTVAGILGTFVSNEGAYMFATALRSKFGAEMIEHRVTGRSVAPEKLATWNQHEPTVASLETKKTVLVFGSVLEDDLPMTCLRIRKAWFQNGCKVFEANSAESIVSRFASKAPSGSLNELAASLVVASKAPSSAEGWAGEVVRSLAEGDACIVTSHTIFDQPGGTDAAQNLSELAKVTGAEFACWGTGGNTRGFQAMGIETGDDPLAVLHAAVDGKVGALWLCGSDPLVDCPEKELAQRALETVPFLVVQHGLPVESAKYASVVLPMTLPFEEDGTYTNCEGRVQRMRAALPQRGSAKPAWRAFAEMLVSDDSFDPPFSAAEVMEKIRAAHSAFQPCGYDAMQDEGTILARAMAEAAASS